MFHLPSQVNKSGRILSELTDPACSVLDENTGDASVLKRLISKSENIKSHLSNEYRWDGCEKKGERPSS